LGMASSVKAWRDVDRVPLEVKLQSAYFEQVGLKEPPGGFSGGNFRIADKPTGTLSGPRFGQ